MEGKPVGIFGEQTDNSLMVLVALDITNNCYAGPNWRKLVLYTKDSYCRIIVKLVECCLNENYGASGVYYGASIIYHLDSIRDNKGWVLFPTFYKFAKHYFKISPDVLREIIIANAPK